MPNRRQRTEDRRQRSDNNINIGYGAGDFLGDSVYGHNSMTNRATSGVSITVDEVKNARTSTETRPINMRVVFIMKVC